MNKTNMLGIALITAAAILSALIATSAGDTAVRLVGKAVWYVPYAVAIGGIRCLVRA